MKENSFTQLPANLPFPEDDGACNQLLHQRLPDLALLSTTGKHINLRQRPGLTVIYAYPMTGRPGVPLPIGWDEIPGAVAAHRSLALSATITLKFANSARSFSA